jgi:DNA-binding transcriptional MerR regulator
MDQIPIFDEQDEELKRYFSISETADMFKISKSQIRFWEKEFDILKPHKNSKGERRFTRQNIQQLEIIYNLLRDRGFTLDGAKKELKRRKNAGKEKLTYIEKLKSLRGFMEKLKEQM